MISGIKKIIVICYYVFINQVFNTYFLIFIFLTPLHGNYYYFHFTRKKESKVWKDDELAQWYMCLFGLKRISFSVHHIAFVGVICQSTILKQNSIHILW